VVEATLTGPGIRPRLIVTWLGLFLVLAVIVALKMADRKEESQRLVDDRSLLPVSIEQVGAIEIVHAGVLHRFERDPGGAWFYHGVHQANQATHSHQTDPAAATRIETALAGFGRTRMERRLSFSEGGREYGLLPPRIIILIYLPNQTQPLAQYAVGDLAPDGFSRYVQILGTSYAVTIADYQIQNLSSLLQSVGARTLTQSAARPGEQLATIGILAGFLV
jgi:hypothetical protein